MRFMTSRFDSLCMRLSTLSAPQVLQCRVIPPQVQVLGFLHSATVPLPSGVAVGAGDGIADPVIKNLSDVHYLGPLARLAGRRGGGEGKKVLKQAGVHVHSKGRRP